MRSFSDFRFIVYIIAVVPVVAIGTLEFQCFNITLYRQDFFFCSLLHCQENYSNLKERTLFPIPSYRERYILKSSPCIAFESRWIELTSRLRLYILNIFRCHCRKLLERSNIYIYIQLCCF